MAEDFSSTFSPETQDSRDPAKAMTLQWHKTLTGVLAGDDSENEGERFAEAVRETADRAGCSFLFELPPVLLAQGDGEMADARRVAAVLCPDEESCSVIFIVLHSSDRRILVLEAADVPERIVEFAFSFTEVMRQLSPVHASYSAGSTVTRLH
jgi:hypothetical protein